MIRRVQTTRAPLHGRHAAATGVVGATPNDFEHHGKVSIWIGKFESAESLEEYVRPKYDDDGMCSRFSKDLGVLYYDHELLEFSFTPRRRLRTIIEAHSWSSSYVDAATTAADELIQDTPNTTIALFDFAFVPWRPSERRFAGGRLMFIGAFDFGRPARPSGNAPSTWRLPCPTCGHVPRGRRRG